MANNKGIWILTEPNEGELLDVSLELVCAGREIADKLGEEVCATVFGDMVGVIDKLAYYGADKVYVLDSSRMEGYVAEFYAEALSSFFKEQTPRIVLCGATLIGNDVAARLGARLRAGVVSDCVALDMSKEGLLLQVKPIYSGKVEATVVCPAARPQIVTVRPGVKELRPSTLGRKAEVIEIKPRISQLRTKVVGFIKADLKTMRLDEAEVIVAGGGGLSKAEDFQLLEQLAELLGGCTGASRIPVEKGWAPFSKQIGQTGITVAPKLYIGCGISGSIYHTMGMKDSKIVIAINKDANAALFKLADVGIVGDLREVVPAITHQLRKVQSSSEADV